MTTKKIIIIVVLILGGVATLALYSSPQESVTITEQAELDQVAPVAKPSKSTSQKSSEQKNLKTVPIPDPVSTVSDNQAVLAPIEFIDKRLSFGLKNYSGIKINIESVVIGRGETAISTGCNGVPNENFTKYLYPGNSICISASEVDGSPRAIVAIHLLIENNGPYDFGNDSDTLSLHYLRVNSSGEAVHRLAYPISGLGSYQIKPYSSRRIILSYLVPEDQTAFDLLVDYERPTFGNALYQDPYENASEGLFIDFIQNNLLLVKT